MKKFFLALLLFAYTAQAEVISPIIGSNPTFNSIYIGTPVLSDTGVALQATGSTNNYFQTILQNTSNGASAETDSCFGNDNMTVGGYQICIGRNSSGYTGTGSFNLANTGYVWSNNGDLTLGTASSNAIHFVINNGATDAAKIGTSGKVLVGSGAITNETNNNAQVLVQNFNDTNYETANIGFMASAQADPSNATLYGLGIYGHGYTNNAQRSAGVVGEGLVTATGDTGASMGVRGYANATHAGGINAGLYGDAIGGALNYALYMNNGGIYSAASQTWTNTGGTTFTAGLTAPTFTSNIATGTAPFTVTSTTPVANLSIGGTASNLSGTPALPNGTTATTQTAGDNSTKIATTAYVNSAISTTSPTVQVFLSGSGTYTKPAGVTQIEIIAVGGGGGGGSSGTGVGTGGSNGGNTTFGTTLIVANGGILGYANNSIGGNGGTASLGTAIGQALSGGMGSASGFSSLSAAGIGGSNALGGAGSGAGGSGASTGGAGTANTGAGGGGANGSTFQGAGGGAGGYIHAWIVNPSATYSYAVGAAGTGQATGGGGLSGGAGGSGGIWVIEYYNH